VFHRMVARRQSSSTAVSPVEKAGPGGRSCQSSTMRQVVAGSILGA
jgi:hypothetical protein